MPDARIAAAGAPFWDEEFGSPGAVHDWGRRPAEALERARAQVAGLIGADPGEIIFTAGATEARSLAVRGLLAGGAAPGPGAVISRVEHPAIAAAARLACPAGALREVPVDDEGRIAPAALAAAIDERTGLVSVVHGQPDIGTLQDAAGLATAVRGARPGALIHLDAGETAGRVPIDVRALAVDALTIGGPALGAPPWCGALWVRDGVALAPLIAGGPQESGRRAGAEAVPAIAMLGAAAELAGAELDGRAARLRALADDLIDRLLAVPGVRLNGPRRDRIPGHAQVSVGDVEGETLTAALAIAGVAASPGSACSGNAAEVLAAIGLAPPWTYTAVLFTCGPATGADEIAIAGDAFAAAVARLRAISPLPPAG